MELIHKYRKYGYIEIEPGADRNIWFTSDHHFFHKNIIRLSNRPFDDIVQMSYELIERWNYVVKPNDIVFNLGDFCWSGNSQEWLKLMNQLNGIQILILGNHDDRKCVENVFNFYKELPYPGNIETKLLDVRERVEIRYEKRRYILDHYPQYSWEGCYHGVYHLHGHIHEKNNEIATVNTYNVSVERNGYRPISLAEINTLLDYQKSSNVKNLQVYSNGDVVSKII